MCAVVRRRMGGCNKGKGRGCWLAEMRLGRWGGGVGEGMLGWSRGGWVVMGWTDGDGVMVAAGGGCERARGGDGGGGRVCWAGLVCVVGSGWRWAV